MPQDRRVTSAFTLKPVHRLDLKLIPVSTAAKLGLDYNPQLVHLQQHGSAGQRHQVGRQPRLAGVAPGRAAAARSRAMPHFWRVALHKHDAGSAARPRDAYRPQDHKRYIEPFV